MELSIFSATQEILQCIPQDIEQYNFPSTFKWHICSN